MGEGEESMFEGRGMPGLVNRFTSNAFPSLLLGGRNVAARPGGATRHDASPPEQGVTSDARPLLGGQQQKFSAWNRIIATPPRAQTRTSNGGRTLSKELLAATAAALRSVATADDVAERSTPTKTTQPSNLLSAAVASRSISSLREKQSKVATMLSHSRTALATAGTAPSAPQSAGRGEIPLVTSTPYRPTLAQIRSARAVGNAKAVASAGAPSSDNGESISLDREAAVGLTARPASAGKHSLLIVTASSVHIRTTNNTAAGLKDMGEESDTMDRLGTQLCGTACK